MHCEKMGTWNKCKLIWQPHPTVSLWTPGEGENEIVRKSQASWFLPFGGAHLVSNDATVECEGDEEGQQGGTVQDGVL